jgi:hypothetical protein
MLRAAIKHGISKALSTRAGFEVWDFEIKEEQPSPDRVTIDIRYRYQPGLCFAAVIAAKGVEGKVPTYEISAEAVPGEVGEKDVLLLAGRHELFTAIERWTTRIEEELSARPSNRVLGAQQKAISYLEKHLLAIPDHRLTREQIHEYLRRLDRLEAAVIELRAPRNEHGNGARAETVQQEFACLRSRLEVLGERSFLHAVLVRLVKYFWDDENLRIIEAGSRAAQDFLKDQEIVPPAPKAEPQIAQRATLPPPPRVPKAETPPLAPVPRPDHPPRIRATPKAEPRAPAAPPKPEPRTAVVPEKAAPATPQAAQRAAYKPLRPAR